jgi:hypothetical protein
MSVRKLEADYLVIGSGAAGMAFVDSLIDECDAQVVMVDRRSAPGGHWNDAYPFVRLHQPSLYFGVNSTPLGVEGLQASGPEAGLYPRASRAEIDAYYAHVMYERLIPSGRVKFLPQHDYVGERRVVSRLSGESVEIDVRKRVVDATYLSPNIPASTPAPFEVAEGASSITVGQLASVATKPERFVIIGAGKTAMDACVWLLQHGVAPDAIQWIKPREAWLVNRSFTQPGTLVTSLLEGISLQLEAAAKATSVDDLCARLEASAQFLRVDRAVRPTMYRAATIGEWELALLRRIENVVRLGHVRRIERDQIVLDQGEVPTTPGSLHVHCAAEGLRRPPALPIFAADRITLQPVRAGLVPFNAAVVGFIEAHRDDDAEKNRLCPPNAYPSVPLDWARNTLRQMAADRVWSKEADLTDWLERARLNPMRGLRDHFGEPRAQEAAKRFGENVRAGIARLTELVGQADA